MTRLARLVLLFAVLLVAPLLPLSAPAQAATTTASGSLSSFGSRLHSFQSGVGQISIKVSCSGKARLSVAVRNPVGTVLVTQSVSCTSGGIVSAAATTNGTFSVQVTETAGRSTSYSLVLTMPDVVGTTTTTTPTIFTLTARSDTYVSKNSPAAAYGAETEVRIDNGDVSPGDAALVGYLTFDLAAQAGASVSSAKMRLYASNPSADAQIIRGVENTSWTEAMTYNTRPAMGANIATTPGNNATGWVEVDVTAYVKSKAGQQVSFGMDQSGTDGFSFNSREGTNKPQLIVSTSSTATTSSSTTTTTAAPTSTTVPSSTTTTAAPTSTTSTTTPTSSPPLWTAGHDAGNLNEWSLNGGGGLYSSGTYEQVASTDISRSGTHSLRARIWTPSSPTSGVRAFRWQEPRANRSLYFSTWVYLPTAYSLTADPSTGQFLNMFQFKSRSADGSRNDPVWAFYAAPDGAGGLYLRAGWGFGGTPLPGPYATDNVSGKFYEPTSAISLPVGRWVHLEAYLHQSNAFDGRLTFWQDGTKLFDFNGVRTSFNNCNYNSWCGANEWAVNLYSDGMSPNPATVYIDDAAISKSYIP